MAKKKTGNKAKTTAPGLSAKRAEKFLRYGYAGLLLALGLVFWFDEITPIQTAVLAMVVGLSAAFLWVGAAAFGVLEIKTRILRASGPIVLFFFGFFAVMATGAPGAFPDLAALLSGRGPAPRQK